jgi:hypothetical protein
MHHYQYLGKVKRILTKSDKSIQEQTAAETKSIGFDYQYYYFLLIMIQLETGQSIGYEVKDDVHIDKENGELILIQLKHSIDTKANLTEKDSDLWKTISNWIKIINDKTQNRSNLADQLNYIRNTTFLLVTNKSATSTNKFLQLINNFNKGTQTLSEIRYHLKQISTPVPGKKPAVVDGYIYSLLSQNDDWLKFFLKNIDFLMSKDSLIDAIKTKIKEKNVLESRLDDVYESIDSNLRSLIYETVKSGNKVTITFDLYYKKFTKYYEMGGRRKKLLIRSNVPNNPLPINPLEYISIKQLVETEIMDERDSDFYDELIRIFTDKLLMYNNEQRWLQDSEITNDELKEFNKLTIRKWKQVFDRIHASLKQELRKKDLANIDKEQLNALALQCYHDVLSLQLTLDETDLEIELSNGKIYLLSNQPDIGWVYDWQERYKKI